MITQFVNANAQLGWVFFGHTADSMNSIRIHTNALSDFPQLSTQWGQREYYSQVTRDGKIAGQQGCGSLREELKNSLRCTLRHSSFVGIL